MISEKELRAAMHELNNVFTIVISSADLVLLDMQLDNPLRPDIENILNACTKGCTLIEQIRAKVISQ